VLPIQHPIEGGPFVTTLDGIEDSIYLHTYIILKILVDDTWLIEFQAYK
jgi:hypothetical protein